MEEPAPLVSKDEGSRRPYLTWQVLSTCREHLGPG